MVRQVNRKYPGVFAGLAFILLMPGIFIQSKCGVQQTPDDVKAFQLIVNYPVVLPNTHDTNRGVRLYNLLDTLTVYTFKSYRIYKLPGVRVFETDHVVPGTERFFVTSQGEKLGMFFKTITDTTSALKLKTDSFLLREAFSGAKFALDPALELVNSFSDTVGHLVEEYATPHSTDPNAADSLYFYFAKSYNHIDYSLSESLDSLRGMKLYKARMLFNGKMDNSMNVLMPKREIFFELRPTKVNHFQQVATLIRKYENE